MGTPPDSYLDFGLSQGPSREYTPPHSYKQLVIPTCGLDVKFNQELAKLLEWDCADPIQANNLSFLIQESYRQMGDCYDTHHSRFFYKLQGNPGESGVPGYPSHDHLVHITWEGKWPQFVTLFRHMAMEFFATVNPYQAWFPGSEFVYHKYIQGGWIFYIQPRRFYDI